MRRQSSAGCVTTGRGKSNEAAIGQPATTMLEPLPAEGAVPGRFPGVAALSGTLLGAGIWLVSPVLTGRAEPWDAPGYFYLFSLLGAGIVLGLIWPRQWLIPSSCVIAGQIIAFAGRILIQQADAGLWPLGLGILVAFSLVSLIGGKLGSFMASPRREQTPL